MPRNIAGKLPFDVLVLIFEQYVSQESFDHPTETLLLVCKAWSRAALDHGRLWSTFNIASGDFIYWCTRVPRRLRRCGPNRLLDITIHFGYIKCKGGYSNNNKYDSYGRIISILAGENGDIARRWRKFEILGREFGRDPHGHIPHIQSELARFLSFPTPNLYELTLVNFQSTLDIFPDTPALQVFSALSSSIPAFPDLSLVSELHVSADVYFEEYVKKAVHLVQLRIYTGRNGDYHLSSVYRHLTSLRLSEALLEDGLKGFAAPALRELHLDFGLGTEFLCVVACKGIPLSRLDDISLGSPERTLETDVSAYRDGLREFLYAASHIKVLRLIDWVSAALVLKLLTSDCDSLYQEHTVLLKSSGYEVELGRGESRLSSVNKLRDRTQNIRDATWEETFEALKDVIC